MAEVAEEVAVKRLPPRIAYRSGYKYQLAATYVGALHFFPPCSVDHPYFQLRPDGTIIVRASYCYDGPSGPTIDTPSAMRGSLIHDVLYQAMRGGLLPRKCKGAADRELEIVCVEDGMIRLRARAWRMAVNEFGSVTGEPERPILHAPR
jgi:hypothetical protein